MRARPNWSDLRGTSALTVAVSTTRGTLMRYPTPPSPTTRATAAAASETRAADGHQLHDRRQLGPEGRRHRELGHVDGHQLHHRRQLGYYSGGGGIENTGTLTVTNSTITGKLGAEYFRGGGIDNSMAR